MSLQLEARGLDKAFGTGPGRISVLRGLDLEVRQGEMVAITGASGVGKTTLLHLLGALDRPDAGSLRLAGEEVAQLTEREAAAFRNRKVGFVFQHHRLLPELTAVENASLPLRIRRVPREPAEDRATRLLGELGLGERLHHRPEELSGGEQQRVAVARAVAGDPALLIADEPTGNLDDAASSQLLELLATLHETYGLTAIIASHSPQVAASCDRVYRMEAGILHDGRT
ncbi:MAG: ABC transporter ATP-binding protein [Acidobacteria bacterium]|nr:ABC transporter ATP-binding protein [Acidobacteriota bacterium]